MSINQPVTPKDMNPGVAPIPDAPGQPGIGDTTCPECHGQGTLKDHTECTNCGGTGRIAEPVGGA